MVDRSCPFCEIDDYVLENARCFAIFDKYPVSPGHMLVIPKEHSPDFIPSPLEDKEDAMALVEECTSFLETEYGPDGYNIGVNCGKAAGQSIFHWHIHIIPRYEGDVDVPNEGIREVIPRRIR